MHKLLALMLFLMVGGVYPCQSYAKEQFFERKDEGWYWYKDPADKKKQEKKQDEPAPAPVSKSEKPADPPFSVSWLRRNLPVLLDRAIDNPTKENIEAYMYAQRITMDKSQRFAEETQKVVYADPYLDENNRVPLASFARSDWLFQADSSQKEAMRHLSKVSAIWLFFDSRCDFCKKQVDILEGFREKYGFIVKYISIDGKALPGMKDYLVDQGQSKTLEVKLTPTTVLVAPPDKYLVVSQGAMAEDQLMERIFLAADTTGLIPKDLVARADPYRRGVLDTKDIEGAPTDDDPAKWVQFLKEKLKGRY